MRIKDVILILVVSFIVSGCSNSKVFLPIVTSPLDGSAYNGQLSQTRDTDPILVAGLTDLPNQTVYIQVYGSFGWHTLANTISADVPNNDFENYYEYRTYITLRYDDVWWTDGDLGGEVCNTCPAKARLRVVPDPDYPEDAAGFITFTTDAFSCFTERRQQGRSIISAEFACGSGTTVTLNMPRVPLLVMSLNVRIQKNEDGVTNSWPNRLPRIVGMIHQYDDGRGPHIIGMQELRDDDGNGPWNDLKNSLTSYRSFRYDRGDGEGLAIFYRPDRLELLEQGYFFLDIDERRELGNCKWWYDKDSLNRIIVWGRFRDVHSDRTFYVYNAHFPGPHNCERHGSALIMAREIGRRTNNADPVIAVGDFNDGQEPNGDFNTSYQRLIDSTGLINTYREINVFYENQEFSTASDFRNTRKGRMIDFVLVSPSFQVTNAGIDHTMFTSKNDPVACGRYDPPDFCAGTPYLASDLRMYSDHWAVWAALRFPP